MKAARFLVGLFLIGLFASPSAFCRGQRFQPFSEPEAKPFTWSGTLVCIAKQHLDKADDDHPCDFKFINEDSGESWDVISTLKLMKIHKKYGISSRAKASGLSFPNLFGAGYLEIHRIEVLEPKTTSLRRGREWIKRSRASVY